MKHTRLLLVGFLLTWLLNPYAWTANEKGLSYAFDGESAHTQTDVNIHLTAIANFKAQALEFEKNSPT